MPIERVRIGPGEEKYCVGTGEIGPATHSRHLCGRSGLVKILVRMSVKEIGIFETKTHLSELIQKVVAGERFVITRRGEPVAELRPVTPERRLLKRGTAAHPDYRMSDDFDRLLISQAQVLQVPIVSADPKIGAYEVSIVW